MFAMLVPGLAPLAARELGAIEGIQVGAAGFDGRSDVLLLEATQRARERSLCMRLTEDVSSRWGARWADGDKPGCIASRIWRLDRVERALSAWATYVSPLRATMTFRWSRVLQERSFLRTDLRRELSGLIERDRPRWRCWPAGHAACCWIRAAARGRSCPRRWAPIQGDARAWLTAVLGEMTRVTRPAGRVVLLVPEIPRAIVPAGLASGERFRLRLLGTPTSIWSYARRA